MFLRLLIKIAALKRQWQQSESPNRYFGDN